MTKNTEITRLTPHGHMDVLSQLEVSQLKQGSTDDGLYETFRRCALAVLNVDSITDNAREVLDQYHDFDIRVIQQARGIKLEIENAPESAFVDGRVITGIREQLFSVLRDITYVKNKIDTDQLFDFDTSEGITNAVFQILRNARLLLADTEPKLVVCWGGHSIGRDEYDYCKEVGYQLGLRRPDSLTLQRYMEILCAEGLLTRSTTHDFVSLYQEAAFGRARIDEKRTSSIAARLESEIAAHHDVVTVGRQGALRGRLLSGEGSGDEQEQCSERREQGGAHGDHRTTKLTSLPGTTTVLISFLQLEESHQLLLMHILLLRLVW